MKDASGARETVRERSARDRSAKARQEFQSEGANLHRKRRVQSIPLRSVYRLRILAHGHHQSGRDMTGKIVRPLSLPLHEK